jgi:hypothetical protein
MAYRLQKIADGPMAQNWDFVAKRGNLLYWRARNTGKLVAKDEVSGQWYRVVLDKGPSK